MYNSGGYVPAGGSGSGAAIGTTVGKSDAITQTLTDGPNTIAHSLGVNPIDVIVYTQTFRTPVKPDWDITDTDNIVIYWSGGTLTNAKIILTI